MVHNIFKGIMTSPSSPLPPFSPERLPTQVMLMKLQRYESFHVAEDRPDCLTETDRSVQEVIKPAMLVVANNGTEYLFFEK